MANLQTIAAAIRADVGKGASRRLRRTGLVPAVLYGGDREPVSLTLEHRQVVHESQYEAFYSSILELQVEDGRTQQVVLRDLQRHPFKRHILHLDFQRVSATEILRISLPVHFVGEDVSPAGRASGVVIQHLMNEIEVAALPKDLPEFLEVDLSKLAAGNAVMLTDVRLPEGVQIPVLATADEPIMVANAIHISESQGTGAAAAAEAEALAEAEAAGLDVAEVGQAIEGEAAAEEEAEGGEEASPD
jgi:large subunit ribosomal protein L25